MSAAPWEGGGQQQQQQAGQGMPAGQDDPFAAMYAAGMPDLAQVNGMTVADALFFYNQHGIAAYPAHPTERKLLLPPGYRLNELTVLTGKDLAAAYWQCQQAPRVRVALIMSTSGGLVTLDADDLAEWKRFRAKYGDQMPVTATASTGDEGHLHKMFWRAGADEDLLKQGKWSAAYPHIEVKSNSLIMAAPSLHESGRRYQWRPGSWPDEIGEFIKARMPPRIDCGTGSGPETIRAVQQALNDGKIPDTYEVAARAVMLSDAGQRPASPHPLPTAAIPMGAPELSNLLAHHTYTYKTRKTEEGPYKVEFTPAASHLTSVLASRSWRGLRPLNGVIGAPVLRPDGTLLQEDGYDQATGLYLARRVQGKQIPAELDEGAVEWARHLLLSEVLGDFPWVGPADKANFVAMLLTQVLRYYLDGAPVPFFPITAPAASSGKTLLATLCGVLFGQASITWTGDDEELRKQLTTVMGGQEGVITFDNVPEGTVIRSAVLSKLLTDRTWGDRLLGGNVLAQFANDRLWCATGNNLRLGGDMITRVVLIAIDPRAPHPERRSGFAIADLESWIRVPGNQRKVLAAVLVLAADWAARGCKAANVVPMRQFTRWAEACGGLLAHHGVEGFLANAGEAEAADDDNASWAGFLARWQTVLGTGMVRAAAVVGSRWDERWEGTFPAGRGDEPLDNAKSMGRRLAGQKDNYHGWHVLRSRADSNDGVAWWWVERHQE